MDTIERETTSGLLSTQEIAAYRRDGFVVVPKLIGAKLIAACVDAISGLASGRIARHATEIAFEPGIDPAKLRPEDCEDHIRKFSRYVEDSDALRTVAMSRRLHLVLDQLLGQGRVMLQDMALIKPPRIGSAKLWHQDASYFRTSDPSLVLGVWVALDAATRGNGCMEVIPGSHLDGPAVHIPAVDVNQCTIRPDQLRLADRVQVEMAPGDALIFHSLLHHYTAPNRSEHRRRAVQFHFNQIGMKWTSLEAHRRQFHDEDGVYAGCTVPKGLLTPAAEFVWPDGRDFPVTPADDWS